jgi:thiamine biosynthesis lipoprotein
MASPCEILIDSDSENLAHTLTLVAAEEAMRIEHKFSRYRKDNIVFEINQGNKVDLDAESAEMIEFANTLFQLSDGMFDVTSGILRKVWLFDGSDKVPGKETITKLLSQIGWDKVLWENPTIHLPGNMQIDLGGIGKEYAVDRCRQLVMLESQAPCLINFGGDLTVTGPRNNHLAWQVGIESAVEPGQNSGNILHLKNGALATSGDSRRYVIKNNKRYGHILNPKTGWPIAGAPRSVTVYANTCTEAGMMAMLGMLQGEHCEDFLRQEEIKFWCIR